MKKRSNKWSKLWKNYQVTQKEQEPINEMITALSGTPSRYLASSDNIWRRKKDVLKIPNTSPLDICIFMLAPWVFDGNESDIMGYMHQIVIEGKHPVKTLYAHYRRRKGPGTKDGIPPLAKRKS